LVMREAHSDSCHLGGGDLVDSLRCPGGTSTCNAMKSDKCSGEDTEVLSTDKDKGGQRIGRWQHCGGLRAIIPSK
jgi:hypothetical protein